MALFRYRSYDGLGAKVEGQIEASDRQVAIGLLQHQGLLVTDINLVRPNNQNSLFTRNKVTLADIEFLTAELSLLLSSGVRIDKGLDIIQKTKAKAALSQLISQISQSLRKGNNLSYAVQQHPDVFEPLYCNLIQLGETSGNIADVFSELAKDLKFRHELRRKVISSLTYPFVILFVCIASVIFIFNFIIPKMSALFTELELMPWYTRALINTSKWMTKYQGWLVVAVIAIGVVAYYAAKRPQVKRWWNEFSLKIPVVNGAIALIERIRFCGSISMMLKSGVRIDQAMKLASGNIKNQILRREVDIARNKIKRGSGLTVAMSQSALFPDFFVSLLEIGEQSGNLERVFDEITNRSREEFESWAQRMTTLIEPLLVLFMGVFVGGVVVVMLLSMVSINEVGF